MKNTTMLKGLKKILLISLVAINLGTLKGQVEEKPNILIFIADDAGMDFGCYGNETIKTPNIDQLASEGIVCEKAFVTAPQCSPSRSSILSGKFAHTIGTEDLLTDLPAGVKLLPAYLKKAGYYSGMMLKSHMGKFAEWQFDWYDHGMFDYLKGHWHDKMMDNFREFLNNKEENPFFLWMAFVDPHRPYQSDRIPDNRAPALHQAKDVIVPEYLEDAPETREDIAQYYDEITRMDDHIGQFIKELKKQKLYDNTIIIFISDNGSPFPGAKGTLFDPGIQTPMVIKWKDKIKPGVRYTHLLSTIDIAPTAMKIAGLEIPGDFAGKSMLPVFKDTSVILNDFIFAERNWHDGDEHMRCVRSESIKLIFTGDYNYGPVSLPIDVATSPSAKDLMETKRKGDLTFCQEKIYNYPRATIQIYDLIKDPCESENLAESKEFSGKGRKLIYNLNAWMRETEDYPPHERKRGDNIDRFTGFPFGSGLPEIIK
ncbi:MAG: sulfatase [Bacteroidota bacterium]